MNGYDVIVVGAGNAAMAAAVSAREQGAERVLMLEKAPEHLRGGNTHYSGGLFRIAFDKPEDLLELVPDVERSVPGFLESVQPYPKELFWADLLRVTEQRADPKLGEILIGRSFETIHWLHEQGISMEASVSLSGIRVGDKIKFTPGAVIRAKGEGVGLSHTWFSIAAERAIEVRYETAATKLIQDGSGRVSGVSARGPNGVEDIHAKAVVLGCGGFESNPQWRAQYLGKPWDHAKVRGTAFNTGDGLRMAMEMHALPYGQWTGCHSTPINAESPPFGDRKLTDKTNRLSYPFGVMLSRRGVRFYDEGEDFQFYTYAKVGSIILNQPGGEAYQIFDQKTVHLLEPRYETSEPITSGTLDGLIDQLNLDREAARDTLARYNSAAPADNSSSAFDPTERDGLATAGLDLPKSNWAQKLDSPPFLAYPVTGGITFTFGGVGISEQGQVLNSAWTPIPGLFACGEMVGGIFHSNYPGGTGLVSGAVFGKIAGASAANA